MAKLKKLILLRPEFEIEISHPVLGRLILLVHLPKLVKIIKQKILVGLSGHPGKIIKTKTVWFIAIPKIKVVDRIE